MPTTPSAPVRRLDGDVGDAEEHARGGAEHDAVVMVGHAEVLAADQDRADDEHRALEGDHADERVGRVGAVRGRERDHEQQQAERGHADADPLAHADLEAEDPLGHDGEDHDAGGEHGLDDRERGVGEGGDVEEPGAGGDGHADREPLARVQLLGRPERMTDVDRRSLVGALVLVEKAQLRRDRAGEREQDAQIQRHVSSYVDSSRDSSPSRFRKATSPASPSLHRFPIRSP